MKPSKLLRRIAEAREPIAIFNADYIIYQAWMWRTGGDLDRAIRLADAEETMGMMP